MKRVLSVTFCFLALAALVVVPASAFAGEGCAMSKTATTTTATTAKMCPAGEAASCAAKLGMPAEECQKLCATGEYTMVNMSIKGMTCTGCESTISTCLSTVPGVVKVGKVSYQEGTAYVLVDPKVVKNDVMLKSIGDKGYTAEVIPAVSLTPVGTQLTGDAKHPCGTAAAAGCGAKCTKSCGPATAKTDTKTETKTETKAEGSK